ncbi:zinc finger protein 736-like [Elgaria multicarinata webbii]|uniref:zinc finger protein 736-like n=1 Tax=Elgaria multicarinata webbii TaxID=159646 RepID=UPI002FCCC373
MYWEVMEENYGSVDFSGGVVIPKPEVFPNLEQEEIAFIRDFEDGDTSPAGTQILNGNKNEHTQPGSAEQRHLPEVQSGECQITISLRPETCGNRTRSRRQWSVRKLGADKALTEEIAAPQREKKHRCHECGHQTYSFSDLARHRRIIHTGEKNYQCFECGKTFYRVSCLYGHLRIHKAKASHRCRKKPIATASLTEGNAQLSKFRDGNPQLGRNEPEEASSRILSETSHSPVTVIHEPECESEGQQGEKTVLTQYEPITLSEGHASMRGTMTHTWVKKLLYS